jgi:Bardet-Biedl syndrome 1 protein
VLEHALLEIPVAVCCYYMDLSAPPAPVIAVAAGSNIYIYRNLKPFFKFTLPNPFVEQQEQTVWDDIRSGRLEPARAREVLKGYKDTGFSLSMRSLDLLAVHEPTMVCYSRGKRVRKEKREDKKEDFKYFLYRWKNLCKRTKICH